MKPILCNNSLNGIHLSNSVRRWWQTNFYLYLMFRQFDRYFQWFSLFRELLNLLSSYLCLEKVTSLFFKIVYYQKQMSDLQKQSSGGVLWKRCSEIFRNINRKTSVLESFFNKVTGLGGIPEKWDWDSGWELRLGSETATSVFMIS